MKTNLTLALVASITGLFALAGCGATGAANCGDGESFQEGGQTYCLYAQGIIEEGFTCPRGADYQFGYEQGAVCSPQPALPPALDSKAEAIGFGAAVSAPAGWDDTDGSPIPAEDGVGLPNPGETNSDDGSDPGDDTPGEPTDPTEPTEPSEVPIPPPNATQNQCAAGNPWYHFGDEIEQIYGAEGLTFKTNVDDASLTLTLDGIEGDFSFQINIARLNKTTGRNVMTLEASSPDNNSRSEVSFHLDDGVLNTLNGGTSAFNGFAGGGIEQELGPDEAFVSGYMKLSRVGEEIRIEHDINEDMEPAATATDGFFGDKTASITLTIEGDIAGTELATLNSIEGTGSYLVDDELACDLGE